MSSARDLARVLGDGLLAGLWHREALMERATRALQGGPPPPAKLVDRLLRQFPRGRGPHPRDLERAILKDRGFCLCWAARGRRPIRVHHLLDQRRMEPTLAGIDAPGLPALPSSGDLADWLGVSAGELEWLADWQGRQQRVRSEALHHYLYRWQPRGGRSPRLIEIPKPRLKAVQRRILAEILDRLPPHPAAHGFRRGRSCKSYVTPHQAKDVVARFDLRDFFPSIDRRQVQAVFRSLGYPRAVARLLTGLCTNSVPSRHLSGADARLDWAARKRLHAPHLPQGAPTSPALANLCAYRLDCRLSGLARHLGIDYTRYADDLAFSGDRRLAKGFDRLHVLIARIALEEGFALNTRKTRLMRASRRQRLAGIVVNERTNPARDEFDRLKATLFNCIRHGPESQNRSAHPDFRSHLIGRVAQVAFLNAGRGAQLRELLSQIDWTL